MSGPARRCGASASHPQLIVRGMSRQREHLATPAPDVSVRSGETGSSGLTTSSNASSATRLNFICAEARPESTATDRRRIFADNAEFRRVDIDHEFAGRAQRALWPPATVTYCSGLRRRRTRCAMIGLVEPGGAGHGDSGWPFADLRDAGVIRHGDGGHIRVMRARLGVGRTDASSLRQSAPAAMSRHAQEISAEVSVTVRSTSLMIQILPASRCARTARRRRPPECAPRRRPFAGVPHRYRSARSVPPPYPGGSVAIVNGGRDESQSISS